MTAIPAMTVTFDDGTVVLVEPKMRDMVGAEAAGHDFTAAGPVRGMYATAFAALQRMSRRELLPDGFVMPESFDAFIDGADIETEPDVDPEGKG